MSFLAGIARRAAETAADPSALQPKDRLLPRRFLGRREVDPEAEEEPAGDVAQPARRQPGASLAREVTTEGSGWAEQDEETPTTEGTPARRMPAARAPDAVLPERTLAPGEPPPEEETPKPDAAAGIKPPNPARALHRRAADAAPTATAAVPAGPGMEPQAGPAPPGASWQAPVAAFESGEAEWGGAGWAGTDADASQQQAVVPVDWPPHDAAPAAPAWTPPATPAASGWRPSAVTIEQIDVLIHEPVPAAAPDTSRRDRARAIDARYLRRL